MLGCRMAPAGKPAVSIGGRDLAAYARCLYRCGMGPMRFEAGRFIDHRGTLPALLLAPCYRAYPLHDACTLLAVEHDQPPQGKVAEHRGRDLQS